MITTQNKAAPGRTAMQYTQPDYTGYLTDDQRDDLSRLQNGLDKIAEFVDRVNSLAAATGLELRQLPTYHSHLMANDISRIVYAHQQAVQRVQAEAMARLAA